MLVPLTFGDWIKVLARGTMQHCVAWTGVAIPGIAEGHTVTQEQVGVACGKVFRLEDACRGRGAKVCRECADALSHACATMMEAER